MMGRTTKRFLVGFLRETRTPFCNTSRLTLLVLNFWMPLSFKFSLSQRINGMMRKKSFGAFSNAIQALLASCHVLPWLAPSLPPSVLPLQITPRLPPPSSSWMLPLHSRQRRIISHLLCWGLYIYLRLDTEMCVRVGHGFPCRDLDRYVSTYEKWIQVEAVSSNQIFVWAMIFPCFYTP